uniref:Protein disulfide isomerase n=1 Tax=Trepomonas sp. PC1 TaxID=1076344 RepID=A0A146KJB4_9EUKA|eukprot:JAP96557.1 Protein disulfide isomerase [Trepomonas sp. PC1]
MISIYLSFSLIKELDSDEMAQQIKNNQKILVKFVIPDCPACKKLKPIFEQVEPLLNIPIVEHDCKQSSICGKYGVYSFPAIILFVNGSQIKYYQDKNAYQIANWVDSQEKFLKSEKDQSTINISTNLKLSSNLAQKLKVPIFIDVDDKNKNTVEIAHKIAPFATESELIQLIEDFKFRNIQEVTSFPLRKMQESSRISLIFCSGHSQYKNDSFIVKQKCSAEELQQILKANQMPSNSVIFYQQKGQNARYAVFSLEGQKIEEITNKFDESKMVSWPRYFKNEL